MPFNDSTLNMEFVGVEQLQQIVWYWRRKNAGQLGTSSPNAPAQPQLFDGPTIARADAAFSALYGRSPQSQQEWLTTYWLVLQNIHRDPDFYSSTIRRLKSQVEPAFLNILPGTTTPCRVTSSTQDRSTVIIVMLSIIFLVVGGAGGIAMKTEPMSTATAIFMGVVVLGIGIGATLMGRSASVAYLCPECGNQLDGPAITRCDLCHLEFAQSAKTEAPRLMFPPADKQVT